MDIASMANKEPVISIIIVSYNTRDMILVCLRSVIDQTSVPYELILVDNASTDNTADAVAAQFPEVRLLAETRNHGFARANNLAAREARGNYLLLLNPDTVILNRAIDRLVYFAQERPEAQIWGGRTLYGDGSLNATSCFQHMTLWKLFCRAAGLSALLNNHRLVSETYGNWKMDDVRSVDVVTGCFFLIPRSLWRDLGGFNTSYFMFGEEADLCLRAKKVFGATPLFTPHAVITHFGGASEPLMEERMVRLLAAKMNLIQRHFSFWHRPVASCCLRSIPFSRVIVYRLLGVVAQKQRYIVSADIWKKVWLRRDEWQTASSRSPEQLSAASET